MAFTTAQKAERQEVVSAALGAWTLAEVRAACTGLTEWMASHPEDAGILDAGEPLSHASDYAELRDAERRMLGFREEAGLEREQVFVQAEKAHELAEITQARRDLLLWRWDYPCDKEKINDLLNHLNDQEALMHVIARELNSLDGQSCDTDVMPERDENEFLLVANQPQTASVA